MSELWRTAMNYFTILQATSLDSGFVLLELAHDYGNGPSVKIPVAGTVIEFPKGKRVEVSVVVV